MKYFIAAALVLACSITGADASTYLSVGGGFYNPSYVEVEETTLDRIEMRSGPDVAVSLGHAFGNWRVELEGSYSRTGITEFTRHETGHKGNTGGSVSTYRALFNGAYDFDLGLPVYPSLLAGFGVQTANVYLGTPMSVSAEDRDTATTIGRGWTNIVPAWQVGMELNLPYGESATLFTRIYYAAGIGTNKIQRGIADGWELEGWGARVGLRFNVFE